MVETVQKITKHTLIPIGLVITIIGAVLWLSEVYFETKANGEGIKEVKQQLLDSQKQKDQYTESLMNIDRRLSRIEGKLDRL